MDSVLWYLIPLALALAISVLPVLAAVLILLSPRPVAASSGYLAGWTVGVVMLVLLFTAIAGALPRQRSRRLRRGCTAPRVWSVSP